MKYGYASLLCLLTWLNANTINAADIKVLSTPTLKAALSDLAGPFEKQTGDKLTFEFEGVPVLKRRIEQGEAFDVTFLVAGSIDDLAKQGKLEGGKRADVARTSAGIAIRAGAPKPNVATVDDLRKVLLTAKSISNSSQSASGSYLLSLFQRLGIESEMKLKLIQVTDRSPVYAVAKGEAELTIITVPNIVAVSGVELGGLLPAEVQNYTTFSAGIAAGTEKSKNAHRLVEFLQSSTGATALRKAGLDPAAP